jgi:hypothetical protein
MASDWTILAYLTGVTLRSVALAALAWTLLALFRIKSPAMRHAVWTLVAAGMLAIAIASAALPAIPVRVVSRSAPPPRRLLAKPVHMLPASMPRPAPPRAFPWEIVYLGGLLLFTGRLAYGYLLTRRLLQSARPIPRFGGETIFESPRISVPMTTGWLRPRILLPTAWDRWEPAKLEAVLVHERNHVRRADWAVAVLAGLNRCVYWFHPLAWWIESNLKSLAEQACDDASLPHVASRECYAQVLVEMAGAVNQEDGRIAWEAMAKKQR